MRDLLIIAFQACLLMCFAFCPIITFNLTDSFRLSGFTLLTLMILYYIIVKQIAKYEES